MGSKLKSLTKKRSKSRFGESLEYDVYEKMRIGKDGLEPEEWINFNGGCKLSDFSKFVDKLKKVVEEKK